MRHIAFPENIDTVHRRLPFFLATEEWVARFLPAGDYFFSWQVDPTVICGRNQEIDKEVNLHYCRENGIDVVRRRSGGGAVFADRENFMFSFITDGDDVTGEFARYTAMIAGALCELGLDARATGRNDITIGGRKVAGNAFYHLPGRCIAHGTMLYNFDPCHLANALTPSKAKLESKGVKSVPSRVTCLRNEEIALSPTEFERFVIDRITDGDAYVVTSEDLEEILKIESTYYAPSFMRIKDPDSMSLRNGDDDGTRHVARNMHIDGLGEFSVDYDIEPDKDTITNFRISGDFFMSGDVDSLLCERINGVRCDRDSVAARLDEIDLPKIIPGLSSPRLVSVIIG